MEIDEKVYRKKLKEILNGIKTRCNPNIKSCPNSYKKLNINICDEWRNDFESFYKWAMDSGFKIEILPNGYNKWSIDRIDNLGDYCPENCRWTTVKEQLWNRTNNRMIAYKGKTQPLGKWCDELNLKYPIIATRLFNNWTVERAFETPIINRGVKTFNYNGVELSATDIFKKYGVCPSNIKTRLNGGWTIKEIIELREPWEISTKWRELNKMKRDLKNKKNGEK